ncbi:ACP S-malonyltransferase [Phytomonospora endophytica]|uniref:[acyl-carrier-protein] S-malonyltransferase n=1 Tax=Phytomonospora endophytica TaxID=714109 RepID=A0A841FXU5_9ACTN|nr:ACP S-malonyltransferase [Phytomonospora endophytica]MBB6039543.1 [acyl-carrier-protein] S-malonyltransferase [Phytomonospora endophytica]
MSLIKKALLCSGQGAQYVGMGRDLCASEKVADDTFQEASDALGLDMRQLCFASTNAELARTENTQPAILTHSMAQFRVLMEREDLDVDLVAGHSLGEITALTIAGAIAFPDAVRLARRRGQYMQQAVPEGRGLMLAIRTRDHAEIAALCATVAEETHEVVSVSNLNSNTQIVVAGHRAAVLRVHEIAEERGLRAVILNVSVPFHCALMEPVAAALREDLAGIAIAEPRIPVLSNVTGRPYGSAAEVPDLLARQVVEPVRWVDDLTYLRMNGFNYAVELGPGDTLAKFSRHTYSEIRTFPYDREQGRTDLHRMIERTTFPFVSRALGVAAATRNTNFDAEAYDTGVVKPYHRLRRMNTALGREERAATTEEMREAMDLLLTILRTKGVRPEERRVRVEELLRDTRTADVFAALDPSGP